MSALGGGLNGSMQHFILIFKDEVSHEGKQTMGVYDR